MPDAVNVRVLHRLEHALRRPILGRLMNGGDDPVEAGELLLRHVDLAARPDIRFDAGENAELRIPLPHLLDLVELLREPAFTQVMRVIRDRVVLVPARRSRGDHFLERVLAVGRPVRVRVQVTAHLGQLDELRELAPARGVELAAVLPQLRRDRLVAEKLVERVLVLGLEHDAGVDRGDSVFGDREPPAHGVFAERDVVPLRPGEVLQQVPVRLRRYDAQVETQTLGRDDRRFRVAVRDDVHHPRKLREIRRQLGRIGRGRHEMPLSEGREKSSGGASRGREPPEKAARSALPPGAHAPRLANRVRPVAAACG